MLGERPAISPLLHQWQQCQRYPGGLTLFHFLLNRRVPYTGTIRARVEELAPGFAKVRMRDRRRLRNHLRSIHAVALTNLGELASGLAMIAALPPDGRGIPMEINIEFLKKARGTIVAEGLCRPPDIESSHEHPAEALLTDMEGDKVARFTARWKVGPRS